MTAGWEKEAWDYIYRETQRRMEALVSQAEVAILAGCHICGRRIVNDNKPTEGAMFVFVLAEDGWNEDRLPLCGQCAGKLDTLDGRKQITAAARLE